MDTDTTGPVCREDIEGKIQEALDLAATAPTVASAVQCAELIAKVARALLTASLLPSRAEAASVSP